MNSNVLNTIYNYLGIIDRCDFKYLNKTTNELYDNLNYIAGLKYLKYNGFRRLLAGGKVKRSTARDLDIMFRVVKLSSVNGVIHINGILADYFDIQLLFYGYNNEFILSLPYIKRYGAAACEMGSVYLISEYAKRGLLDKLNDYYLNLVISAPSSAALSYIITSGWYICPETICYGVIVRYYYRLLEFTADYIAGLYSTSDDNDLKYMFAYACVTCNNAGYLKYYLKKYPGIPKDLFTLCAKYSAICCFKALVKLGYTYDKESCINIAVLYHSHQIVEYLSSI
jgi:hypothetical protein